MQDFTIISDGQRMQNFIIIRDGQRLILRLDRTPGKKFLAQLSGWGALLCVLCFLYPRGLPHVPIMTANTPISFSLLPLAFAPVLITVVCAASLTAIFWPRIYQVFVVDQSSGNILLNRRKPVPITELQEVRLTFIRITRPRLILSLYWKNGVTTNIITTSPYGSTESEMQKAAETISRFMRVSVTRRSVGPL